MMPMQWIAFVILMLIWSNERRIAAGDTSTWMSTENATSMTELPTEFTTTTNMNEASNTAATQDLGPSSNSTTTEAHNNATTQDPGTPDSSTMTEANNTAATQDLGTPDNNTTTEAPGKNLPLILGLSLGLGLGVPATVAAIGGAVYYFKVYRPKHNQILVKGH